MYTLTTKINGEEVDVDYTYEKGHESTWDEPGCPDDCEVHKVWYKGVNILPIVHESDMDEIYKAIEKDIEDGDDY